MSGKASGGQRSDRDADFTPLALSWFIVRTLWRRIIAEGRTTELQGRRDVWELHAGGGAFVGAARQIPGAVVSGCDLGEPDQAPGVAMCDHQLGSGCGQDALELFRAERPPLLIVGNPPFSTAEEHVRQALYLGGAHVCMLLPIGFYGAAERTPLFREHVPCRVDICAPRPSFRGDPVTGIGPTDGIEYGVFWWDLLTKTRKDDTRTGRLEWR